MQLKKLIPAVMGGILAALLSLTLFLTVIPQAAAEETPEPIGFNQSVSGYLYGSDYAIYPYTCSLIITTERNDYLDIEYEQMVALMDLRTENNHYLNPFGEAECYTETLFYYPDEDRYEEKVDYKSASGVHSVALVGIGIARTEEGGIAANAEIHRVRAVFFVDGVEVATITWHRDQ